ncbi:oxidized low-density lipoprotein receptor 1 [Tachyglossus aculeatus]|uniref:oxidized low-density lipoprotein receptor 1 n=1 Tax=Tachyglossus aculeatus TaxID=9261 RepID=UPI0018F686C8|nr:oxidized low-density lipoprotein receptor 1 [Tachyglossus aculeatus]
MEDSVQYAELKFKMPEEKPKQKLPEEKAKDSSSLSPWWFPAAIVLGIFSFGLLGAVAVLGLEINQAHGLMNQQVKNYTHLEGETAQFTDQKEVAKATPRDQEHVEDLLGKLENITEERNALLLQNEHLQEALKKVKNYTGPCPQDWLWHTESCYSFPSRSTNWKESQENCASQGAQLLKVDNQDELEFIYQATVHSRNPFWLGLRRSEAISRWLWADGSAPFVGLLQAWRYISHTYPSGTCAYIFQDNIFAENCIITAFSICERKANLLKLQ